MPSVEDLPEMTLHQISKESAQPLSLYSDRPVFGPGSNSREGNSLSAVFPAQTEKSFLCRSVHTPRGKFTFSGFAREEVSVSQRAGLDGFSLSWLFPAQTDRPVFGPGSNSREGNSLSAVFPAQTEKSFLCRSVHTPRGKFTFRGFAREEVSVS